MYNGSFLHSMLHNKGPANHAWHDARWWHFWWMLFCVRDYGLLPTRHDLIAWVWMCGQKTASIHACELCMWMEAKFLWALSWWLILVMYAQAM
jgi:hypothetical protein